MTMKNHPRQIVTVADLLQGHTPQVRLVVQELGNLVRQAAPEAIESAHPVWHSIQLIPSLLTYVLSFI